MTILVDKNLNIINKENEIIAQLVFDNSKDLFHIKWEVKATISGKISYEDESECMRILHEWNCSKRGVK